MLAKRFVVRLFCYCREAERSVDFAISGGRQWTELLEYYHDDKRRKLRNVIQELNQRIPPGDYFVAGRDRHPYPRAWRVFPWLNARREEWRFSLADLLFFRRALHDLLSLLEQAEHPGGQRVIDLRMDLHACEWIIECRLAGVPELKRAADIVHFCQAAHVRPVTMEELGVA